MRRHDQATSSSARLAAHEPGDVLTAAPQERDTAMTIDQQTTASPLTELQMGLHHVGIVVADLDAAVARYAALGFAPAGREVVADQGVAVAAFRAPPGYVELISPLDAEGAIARFLAKRGDGMHHAAYRVADIAATLDRLDAAGVRLIDRQPRVGLHGWRVAFIHPEACAGVLTELVEV